MNTLLMNGLRAFLAVLPFASTAFADMPMLLISGQQPPSLLQWTARDQSPRRIAFPADMEIASIAASPDGQYIAVTSRETNLEDDNEGNTISIIDVDLARAGSPNAEVARVQVGTDDPNGQTRPLTCH